eukprot:scaffold133422_cov81-Phaeocystis_antarctica.AAC.1
MRAPPPRLGGVLSHAKKKKHPTGYEQSERAERFQLPACVEGRAPEVRRGWLLPLTTSTFSRVFSTTKKWSSSCSRRQGG